MPLDPTTLLVINAVNLFAMALILPFIMGQRLSPAARSARLALIVQAMGWAALIASGYWFGMWQDRALSTLSMAFMGYGQWLMFRALQGWLGPRPYRVALLALIVVLPVGYLLSFDHYAVRVGWSNFLFTAQLLIMARATLWPETRLRGRWRWVMLMCFLTMAALTFGRGLLGAFFTELYPSFRAPHPVNLLALLAANVTFVMGNVAVLVAWRHEAEQQLRNQAHTDGLTGVLNLRGWQQHGEAMLQQARRHGFMLTLAALDLDHFKRINDTHGHETGDQALRLFARELTRALRSGDKVARLGGEEFCVLLFQADETAGLALDRRLRAALARTVPQELGLTLDFSAGVAVLGPHDLSLNGLRARADAALYQAKNQGRGRMVIAAPETAAALKPGAA